MGGGQANSDEAKYVVNMEELSAVIGHSLPKLRRDIDGDPDFPVLERGTNGQAYKLDVRDVKKWYEAQAAETAEAEHSRRQDLADLQKELFGEAVDGDELLILTPAAREKLAAARYRENQLAEQQGRLVKSEEVRFIFEQTMIVLRKEFQTLSADVCKKWGLDRPARIEIEDTIKGALDRAADRLEKLDQDAVRAA